MLTLVPDARAAAQDVDDDWTVTPEEIEAARSEPLFQTDDVLDLTLYADFNSIRRQGHGKDAEERPALVYLDGERSEEMLSVVRNFDELDEDRGDRVIEHWKNFFEIAADEGRHDRILRDCHRMPE